MGEEFGNVSRMFESVFGWTEGRFAEGKKKLCLDVSACISGVRWRSRRIKETKESNSWGNKDVYWTVRRKVIR